MVDFRRLGLRIPPRVAWKPTGCNPWAWRGEVAMPERPPDARELGYYFSLAQVGLEMVVPVVVGLLLDHYLGWRPWGVVVGAVLGLVTGLTHLITMTDRRQDSDPGASRRDAP